MEAELEVPEGEGRLPGLRRVPKRLHVCVCVSCLYNELLLAASTRTTY